MKFIFTTILTCALLWGCKKDGDPYPAQLLKNTDMESGTTEPDEWLHNVSGSYSRTWSTDESASPGHSLAIAGTNPDEGQLPYWQQNYTNTMPVGRNLIFRVRIKCIDVTGSGVSLTVRGSSGSGAVSKQVVSTQDIVKIGGTFDWQDYEIILPAVRADINVISVYLVMLPHSTGKVYFDDATLVHD